MRKHRLRNIVSTMLLMALVMGLAIPALAAETDHRYGFDISAIPDDQWQQAQCEIHVILTEADGTESTTIIKAKEGYGSPVFLNAKVYDRTTGKAVAGWSLSTYWVPARLFTEALGLGEIDWDSARRVATLETYRGTVDLQPDSTYVELPDGTKVVETEYTVGPDSQAIEVVKNRNGRLYVPIRFWLNLCFQNAEFDWSRPGVLVVRATRPKAATTPTEVTWTGVRDLSKEMLWLSSAKDLPHIAKAIEETHAIQWNYGDLDTLAVRPADAISSGSIQLESYYGGELRITGLQSYLGIGSCAGGKVLIRAILEDIVSDSSDINTIMSLIEQGDEVMKVYQGAEDNSQAEKKTALKRLEELGTVYELNSVKVDWTQGVNYGPLDILRLSNK